MELSKEEKIMALASALYLMGIELEDSREKLETLCEQGLKLSDPRVLKAQKRFSRLAMKYSQLEEQYMRLKGEI